MGAVDTAAAFNQLRRFGDIDGDPGRLMACEQISGGSTTRVRLCNGAADQSGPLMLSQAFLLVSLKHTLAAETLTKG